MKNTYTLLFALMVGFLPIFSDAQVNFTENFNASGGGWTGYSWFTGTTACGGTGGAQRYNLYFPGSAALTSPQVGTSVGGVISMSYDYKVAIWSANTTGQSGDWGFFDVQYGSSPAGPWTTVETVSPANHTVSGNCATRNITFSPSAGALYIRFNGTYGTTGDYYLNFDNITMTEATTPCAGTPAPGNTLASLSAVCSNQNTVLTLQNATTGVGVTYQWQSSSDGVTYANIPLATNASFSTSQSAATYYQCIVTCAGNNATSSPVQVTMQPFSNCYCTPTYTTGTAAGDLISNVEIIGTTLSNNTGFAAGTPSYTFYTGQPNYTATLMPSSTYNLSVSTGEWGSQGFAAWIDYNDDGVFTTSPDPLLNERIGFTPTTIGTGYTAGSVNASSTFPITLACNPPAGVHRMRVRCSYFTNGPVIDPCITYSYGETEDYNITIATPPPCPAAGTIVNVDATSNSADIAWLTGCSATNTFNIEYGPSGFTQGTGTVLSNQTVTISNDTVYYTINGLTDNTEYDVYYQGVCGGGTSPWTFGGTFLTSCVAISAVGYCESFDAISTTEACWSVLNNNNDLVEWDLNDTSNPFSGENAAAINTDFNFGQNDDYLISPQLILTGNEILTFRYAVFSEFEPNDFRVVLSTTGTNPADFTTELMALDQYSNTTYEDTSINLSAFTGNVYIAFHIPSGGLDGWILYIDEVCIDVCVPAPGVDGSVDVCRLDSLVNLNDVITPGQTNGSWSFPPNPGIVSDSMMNIISLADSDYDALYIVQTACTSDTTIATVNVFDASSAGEDGTLEVCTNTTFNLLDGLSGLVDLGGTWYDPSNQPLPGNNTTTTNIPGMYNYDYITGNGVCPDDTANVLVEVTNCGVGIDENVLSSIHIYPNPTTGSLYISNVGNLDKLSYAITDINGQVVRIANNAINSDDVTMINLESLPRGMYFLTLTSEEGERMFRFVLQ